MKTENTLENKVKFFAQYWGQKCGKNKYGNLSVNKSNILNITHLELKPLSHITDEDAINLGYGYSSHLKSNLDRNIDQLRKLGFAVNWMDLSVEDLVKYGWVKLKEN